MLTTSQTHTTSPQAALALAIKSLEGRGLNGSAGDAGIAIETLRRMLVGVGAGDLLPPESLDGTVEADPPQVWARSLRGRREEATLSRAQLARLSGISDATLRGLEEGRRPPTRQLLQRLLAVKELGLSPADTLMNYPFTDEADDDPTPNCWLAPGFDSIKMVKELALALNGVGGHIEQSALYLDHMSSACWCSIADQEDYVAAQTGKPLDRAAAQILRSAGAAGLDVLALGCGDGKNEVRLTEHLVQQADPGDLRLYLLDISQPLLSSAYKHAADSLADRRGVAMFAIQGNFHDLPRYTQLLYTAQRAHRRRVACMLGYTFGNLQNELLFVRNSLVGFAPGDMLLLDVGLVCAPIDRPDEIQARDPRLSGKLPIGWKRRYDEWLAGPIRRYAKDVQQVEFAPVLDTTSCPVPGSYSVEIVATVRFTGGEERKFSIFRVRRYEPIQLINGLKRLGWDPVDGWAYGNDPRLLYLFKRRET